MRSFKRPLSILIAALMLVSIMVIAPVTASAADGDTVTYTVSKWVKGNALGDNHYEFTGLYENLSFLRVNPNLEFDYSFENGNGAIWNRSRDKSLNGNNTCYINGTGTMGDENGWMLCYWAQEGGHSSADGYLFLEVQNDLANNSPDFYAYTWEEFELTEHSANTLTDGDKHNINCYTNGDRYFLQDGESYKEVEKSEVFFDYVTADGNNGVNYDGTVPAGEGDANVYGFGTSLLPNIGTLGCQQAIAVNNGTIRFVSVLNTKIAQDADEYGYIVAKTNKKTAEYAMQHGGDSMRYENVGNGTMVKYNCKGTSNMLSGDYGDYNADTPYKYVTFSVNELDEVDPGWVIMTRFYIKKGGTVMYSQYGDYNCLAYAIS